MPSDPTSQFSINLNQLATFFNRRPQSLPKSIYPTSGSDGPLHALLNKLGATDAGILDALKVVDDFQASQADGYNFTGDVQAGLIVPQADDLPLDDFKRWPVVAGLNERTQNNLAELLSRRRGVHHSILPFLSTVLCGSEELVNLAISSSYTFNTMPPNACQLVFNAPIRAGVPEMQAEGETILAPQIGSFQFVIDIDQHGYRIKAMKAEFTEQKNAQKMAAAEESAKKLADFLKAEEEFKGNLKYFYGIKAIRQLLLIQRENAQTYLFRPQRGGLLFDACDPTFNQDSAEDADHYYYVLKIRAALQYPGAAQWIGRFIDKFSSLPADIKGSLLKLKSNSTHWRQQLEQVSEQPTRNLAEIALMFACTDDSADLDFLENKWCSSHAAKFFHPDSEDFLQAFIVISQEANFSERGAKILSQYIVPGQLAALKVKLGQKLGPSDWTRNIALILAQYTADQAQTFFSSVATDVPADSETASETDSIATTSSSLTASSSIKNARASVVLHLVRTSAPKQKLLSVFNALSNTIVAEVINTPAALDTHELIYFLSSLTPDQVVDAVVDVKSSSPAYEIMYRRSLLKLLEQVEFPRKAIVSEYAAGLSNDADRQVKFIIQMIRYRQQIDETAKSIYDANLGKILKQFGYDDVLANILVAGKNMMDAEEAFVLLSFSSLDRDAAVTLLTQHYSVSDLMSLVFSETINHFADSTWELVRAFFQKNQNELQKFPLASLVDLIEAELPPRSFHFLLKNILERKEDIKSDPMFARLCLSLSGKFLTYLKSDAVDESKATACLKLMLGVQSIEDRKRIDFASIVDSALTIMRIDDLCTLACSTSFKSFEKALQNAVYRKLVAELVPDNSRTDKITALLESRNNLSFLRYVLNEAPIDHAILLLNEMRAYIVQKFPAYATWLTTKTAEPLPVVKGKIEFTTAEAIERKVSEAAPVTETVFTPRILRENYFPATRFILSQKDVGEFTCLDDVAVLLLAAPETFSSEESLNRYKISLNAANSENELFAPLHNVLKTLFFNSICSSNTSILDRLHITACRELEVHGTERQEIIFGNRRLMDGDVILREASPIFKLSFSIAAEQIPAAVPCMIDIDEPKQAFVYLTQLLLQVLTYDLADVKDTPMKGSAELLTYKNVLEKQYGLSDISFQNWLAPLFEQWKVLYKSLRPSTDPRMKAYQLYNQLRTDVGLKDLFQDDLTHATLEPLLRIAKLQQGDRFSAVASASGGGSMRAPETCHQAARNDNDNGLDALHLDGRGLFGIS